MDAAGAGDQAVVALCSERRQVLRIMRATQSLCRLRQEEDIIPLGFWEGPRGSRETDPSGFNEDEQINHNNEGHGEGTGRGSRSRGHRPRTVEGVSTMGFGMWGQWAWRTGGGPCVSG